MNEVKLLPYGISNFEDIRSKNRYCVDKTMFISKLENSGDFLFLIRPRRFGKSIFLSMLQAYYDMEKQDKFDELFGGFYIHDNPTKEKGMYQVVYFDFSQAGVGKGSLEDRFHTYCSQVLIDFADKYRKYYNDDFYDRIMSGADDSAWQLREICLAARSKGYPLYLIIDEYDNFTNNVLSQDGKGVYHALTHATGFYRDVFKLYKPNFSRVLMMGVSPVTMDDLTSGYNVGRNISMLPKFNMMLGFSETDVREMIDYYREAGVITAESDALIADMKPWYDNYCFSVDCLGVDPKMFNCDMVLYYLNNYIEMGRAPEQMVDSNTRTDYKKLKRLIELDHITNENKSIIHQIAADGQILAWVNTSFPAERIYEKDNFVSLLYYYGMLTISGEARGKLLLSIPNNNVRKQYYEYMLEDYQVEVRMELFRLSDAMGDLAFDGDWRPALTMIADKYRELSSVRSAIQGERHVQGFFMAYLNFAPYYLTAPEVELNHGYCDFFLMPDHVRYAQVSHSYILELKYLGASATEAEAERQWAEGVEQIRGYAKGDKVAQLTKGSTLHLLILQIRNYEMVRLEEIEC